MKVKKIDSDYRELAKKKQEQQQKRKEEEFKKVFVEHRERLKEKQEQNKPFSCSNGSGAKYYNNLCRQMFRKWPRTKYVWGEIDVFINRY